jgi:hypothetical protein
MLTLITLMLSACATQYEADADADQLVIAMQDLPDVRPFMANVQFYPEPQNGADLSTGKVEAKNADDRNLTKIIIPEDQMLNLAGHASIFRWFQDDGSHDDLPYLNVHARIYTLDHSIRVVKGRMQPIAKSKIEVFITDTKNNRIYESVFSGEGIGKEGGIIRNKRETQDLYGQAIYKSMLLAFENAFEDISNDLNLRPIDFDIDKIEINEDALNQQQADSDKSLQSTQEAKALTDADLEDI